MMRNYMNAGTLLTVLLALAAIDACASNTSEHFPESAAQRDMAPGEAGPGIDDMQAPPGVDPVLFAELKAGLKAALLDAGVDRYVSAAPSGAKNAVADLLLARVDDTTATATWTYRNAGDYNQDSEVGGSDITPIALHYRKTAESADWALAQLADGDINGEVNAADIAPIAANYQSTLSAYSVQMTSTPDEESSWTEVALAEFSGSTVPDGGGKRQFSIELPAVAGQTFRVVPLSGAVAGTPGLPYDYDGTGGKPVMPFEEREQIMDEIQAELVEVLQQFTELPMDERIEARAAAMVTFMEGLDGLEDPYVSGGSAWANFSDGRPLVVNTNREFVNESEANSLPADPPAGQDGKETSTIHPQGRLALLLDGTAGQGIPTDHAEIIPGLTASGYQVVRKTMTIDELLNVGGESPVSIVHIDSHGEKGKEGGFQLVSATPVTKENDETYIDLHRDLSLFYGLNAGGKYYGLTDTALADIEWGLAPGALVYLNCCHSGTDSAAAFRQRLIDLGAATVLGWNDPVGNDAANARMLQIYDDALGLDSLERGTRYELDYKHPIDSPPMRPFSLQEIMDYKGNHDAVAALFDRDVLLLTTGSNAVLAPSIRRFEILEPAATPEGPSAPHTILRLFGEFGTLGESLKLPKVWIGEQELLLEEFPYSGSISAILPSGVSGPIQVGFGDGDGAIRSNKANITEWHGQFNMTLQSPGGIIIGNSGEGTITYNLVFDIHMRADVRKTRLKPGDTPVVPPTSDLYFMPDSSVSYSISGTLADYDFVPGATYTESGSGEFDFKAVDFPIIKFEDHGTHMAGFVRAAENGAIPKLLLTSRLRWMPVDITKYYPATGEEFDSGTLTMELGFGPDSGDRIELLLNEDYSIVPGTIEYESLYGPVTTTWDSIPAVNPPDPEHGV
ncbi:MAG: hypothetical protein H7A35_06430 [Planctomycetales bacterium]|nr:MAG: hypothetical protein H7A35_06430 [Planctomycetales bacterium]